jgi:hypothetical protein
MYIVANMVISDAVITDVVIIADMVIRYFVWRRLCRSLQQEDASLSPPNKSCERGEMDEI